MKSILHSDGRYCSSIYVAIDALVYSTDAVHITYY
jgi:hypothetical protein